MTILNFKWPSRLRTTAAINRVLISHRFSGIKKRVWLWEGHQIYEIVQLHFLSGFFSTTQIAKPSELTDHSSQLSRG